MSFFRNIPGCKTRPCVLSVILVSKHKHANWVSIRRCGGTNDVEAIKPVITLLPVRINGTKIVKTSSEFCHAKHFTLLHPTHNQHALPLLCGCKRILIQYIRCYPVPLQILSLSDNQTIPRTGNRIMLAHRQKR